jgi:hypothetical protein
VREVGRKNDVIGAENCATQGRDFSAASQPMQMSPAVKYSLGMFVN